MERVTPEKNEAAFKKWERERRWLMRSFWIFVFLCILIFVLSPQLYPLAPMEVTEHGAEERWLLPAVVVLGLIYVIAIIVIWWRYFRWILGKLSKEACIFAAIVAADDLERGNPVKASLSMDRLLLALSDFLRQKSVALGVSYVTPHDFMHVTPETIPRRAVRQAIQAKKDTRDFQERLRDVAIGLCGNMDEGYLAAHQFLVWLDRKTERYQQVSKSFLEKRPALRTILLSVFPIILPPIAGIVVAVMAK